MGGVGYGMEGGRVECGGGLGRGRLFRLEAGGGRGSEGGGGVVMYFVRVGRGSIGE